jgi:hypothetical protein
MRLATEAKLQIQIGQIEMQITELRSEGDCLLQSWICEVKPSGKMQSYPRVQSRLPQFGGKKVRHIGRGECVADWANACDRGQRLGKLIKLRDRLAARLQCD